MGGLGSNGAYQNEVDNYLQTRAVDCSGWSTVYLQFYRWLNVCSGDRAYISINGQVVWENYESAISESAWSEQILDISSYTADYDSVIVRFGLQSNLTNYNGGWNIDDVIVSEEIILGVKEEQNTTIVDKFILYQNYPNPFNASTTIKFDLPEQDFISLKIYNIIGQEVKTLVSSEYLAGTYRITWDGKNNSGVNAASGLYILRLTGEKYHAVRKILLLK